MKWLQQLATLFDCRTALIAAVIFIPLERLFPLRLKQQVLRCGWRNDSFYLIFNRVPIMIGIMLLIWGIVGLTPLIVPQPLRDFVGGLSLLVQVPVAILMADVGFYTAHRLFHAVPWLWRFHAVHHSIEQMDWLAASRVHPIDQILTKGISLTPLFMLGFSTEAVAIHGIIYFIQSYLIHANIRLKFGRLRWLLASPEFHHWHHSNQREAWNKNFAGQLPFLDAMFGTAHMPTGRMPTIYGVDDPVPNTYLAQFAYPFRATNHRRPR